MGRLTHTAAAQTVVHLSRRDPALLHALPTMRSNEYACGIGRGFADHPSQVVVVERERDGLGRHTHNYYGFVAKMQAEPCSGRQCFVDAVAMFGAWHAQRASLRRIDRL